MAYYNTKKFAFAIVLFFIFSSTKAQTYISFGAGYLFPKGGSRNSEYSYSPNFPYSVGKVSNFSFASGVGMSLGVGYMMNKNFGFELGVTSVFGKTFTYTATSYGFTPPFTTITKYSAPISAFVNPSMVFKANAIRGIIPYCKVGLLFLAYGKQNSTMNFSNNYIYAESEISNRFTVGTFEALGISIPVTKKISMGIECYAQSINPYNKKLTLIKHQTNGVDDLSKMSVSSKEGVYVKNVDASNTTNPDQPAKYLAYTNNYSNIGLMVHMYYTINTK